MIYDLPNRDCHVSKLFLNLQSLGKSFKWWNLLHLQRKRHL
jgi:hypothetical protein